MLEKDITYDGIYKVTKYKRNQYGKTLIREGMEGKTVIVVMISVGNQYSNGNKKGEKEYLIKNCLGKSFMCEANNLEKIEENKEKRDSFERSLIPYIDDEDDYE